MEKERFEEIAFKLNYEKDKWLIMDEIDSIILKNGVGFYPDWKHMKFKVTDKGKIDIQHGTVRPYGARLSGLMSVSGGMNMLYFRSTQEGIQIESSSFYGQGFRQPKAGDVVRISENVTKVYGESIIKAIKLTMNSIIIELWEFIDFPQSGKISFYDPSVYRSNKNNCVHSDRYEGIYMEFIPNNDKEKHQDIKIKDIKEINLSVGSKYFNKTYRLE